jgi:hypothetical protein
MTSGTLLGCLALAGLFASKEKKIWLFGTIAGNQIFFRLVLVGL